MFDLQDHPAKLSSVNPRAEKLNIDYGMGGKSDIVLSECDVDGIRIEPMNGGSVTLGFRVLCHPDSKQFGQLCELIQQEVEISVIPPDPKDVHELFGEEKKAA